MQGQYALLLDALDRHETHVRSTHGFADCLRVGRIGLVTLDVGLYVLRWDQADEVPEPGQLPSPVVGARACLDSDYTWRLLREKRQHVRATQTTPKNTLAGIIDTVHLENGLRDIQANRGNVHSGSSPPAVWTPSNSAIPGCRTGAVHAIKWAVQRARYMTLETMAPLSDDPFVKLPAVAA